MLAQVFSIPSVDSADTDITAIVTGKDDETGVLDRLKVTCVRFLPLTSGVIEMLEGNPTPCHIHLFGSLDIYTTWDIYN
jgi:hypothetical protein